MVHPIWHLQTHNVGLSLNSQKHPICCPRGQVIEFHYEYPIKSYDEILRVHKVIPFITCRLIACWADPIKKLLSPLSVVWLLLNMAVVYSIALLPTWHQCLLIASTLISLRYLNTIASEIIRASQRCWVGLRHWTFSQSRCTTIPENYDCVTVYHIKTALGLVGGGKHWRMATTLLTFSNVSPWIEPFDFQIKFHQIYVP